MRPIYTKTKHKLEKMLAVDFENTYVTLVTFVANLEWIACKLGTARQNSTYVRTCHASDHDVGLQKCHYGQRVKVFMAFKVAS